MPEKSKIMRHETSPEPGRRPASGPLNGRTAAPGRSVPGVNGSRNRRGARTHHCRLKVFMRILGIESSCDETAAAVVDSGGRILSSVVSSQISTHARYGGVVPELASREHLRAIVPAVRLALEEAATAP